MYNEEEWMQDCIKERGRILVGKFRHYCYDWDFMTVDETCEEFENGCNCTFAD